MALSMLQINSKSTMSPQNLQRMWRIHIIENMNAVSHSHTVAVVRRYVPELRNALKSLISNTECYFSYSLCAKAFDMLISCVVPYDLWSFCFTLDYVINHLSVKLAKDVEFYIAEDYVHFVTTLSLVTRPNGRALGKLYIDTNTHLRLLVGSDVASTNSYSDSDSDSLEL